MLLILFMGYESWIIAGYACFGVLITGFYILIDLVKIMTPDVISYDDYILGALMLYVDIVRLLLYLIMLFGKRK